MAQLAGDFGKVAADGLPRHVILDFSRLTFIRPAGVCFLSNLVQWLAAKRVRASFKGIGRITPPLKYLDDSLFFKQHLGEKLLPFSAVRSTTLPLRKVASADSHMWLRRTFVPWLSGRLRVPERALSSIQTCVSELFNNITDHTKLDIGSIFIQHFPTERRVIVAVSDFGRGIPRAVRTVRPQLTDSQAIARAVEEGFTSLSSPRNRGSGLAYLLRVALLANGGCVTIYSLRGIVRCMNEDGEITLERTEGAGFCPGTLIEIELRTENIRFDPEDDGGGECLEW